MSILSIVLSYLSVFAAAGGQTQNTQTDQAAKVKGEQDLDIDLSESDYDSEGTMDSDNEYIGKDQWWAVRACKAFSAGLNIIRIYIFFKYIFPQICIKLFPRVRVILFIS